MRPEINLPRGSTIIEESMRIRDALLDMHAIVASVTDTAQLVALSGIREKLGYEPHPERADLSSLVDVRSKMTPMISPSALATVLPITPESAQTTEMARKAAADILTHRDDRVLFASGGCSSHDPEQSIEYGRKYVLPWRKKYGDYVEVDERVYTEKPRSPRSTVEWKGLTYDPLLDGSHDINLGLVASRMMLSQLTHLGVPIVMETLNANTPQFIDGLVAYYVVGARNATDQTTIERVSGTSSITGVKNPLTGSIEDGILASLSAQLPHTFLGIGMSAWPMEIRTTGNETAHLILRGGTDGPNYSKEHIDKAKELLAEHGMVPSVAVDASHGNSGKDYRRQIEVVQNLSGQIAEGEEAIRVVFVESNLVEGSQKLIRGQKSDLKYGVSVTDGCAGPDQTEEMIATLAEGVAKRRERRAA